MKKSAVILLMTVVMMITGCQNKEVNSEIVVPSETEIIAEENVEIPSEENVEIPSEENVQTEETSTENIHIEENSKENVYKEQIELVYQALSQKWSIDQYFENEI